MAIHSTKREVREADRISFLPNEILGFILSFLPLKEANKTAILSRKWKSLWQLTPRLHIDGADSMRKVKNSDDLESELQRQRNKFVRFVDRAIALNQSSNLEEFRVVFDLDRSYREWIDSWLGYAVSRKVRRLELDLTDVRGNRTEDFFDWMLGCYSFPYKLGGNLPPNFVLLKQLSLHSVEVSGEDLQFFLQKCTLLETLSVSESYALESLEIVRPHQSFKCLEINYCENLKSVVVRHSKVAVVKYVGGRIDFVLANVPQLTQLWIGTDHLDDVVFMFSSLLPKLHVLKLYFRTKLKTKESSEFVAYVDMCSLRELVVCIGQGYSDRASLMPVVNLISATRCLQRFVVEAVHQHSDFERYWDHNKLDHDKFREVLRNVPRAYFYLKEVEFIGYRGVISHFEVMLHFVDNAIALRNIALNLRGFELATHRPWERSDRFERRAVEDEMFARALAHKDHIPLKINVKIL